MQVAYYDMIGDDETARKYERRIRWNSDWALACFRFFHGLLFASLIIAALIVVFGCFNIGIAYGFGQICAEVVASLDGLCFSLNVFGIDGVPCGTEFQGFCDGFAQKEIVITLWGAFVIAAGHYYLISSAGAASMQFRAVLGTLYLLPKRDQYLANVAHLSQLIDKEKLDRIAAEHAKEMAEIEDDVSDEKSGVEKSPSPGSDDASPPVLGEETSPLVLEEETSPPVLEEEAGPEGNAAASLKVKPRGVDG
jgi:hypothetical protein